MSRQSRTAGIYTLTDPRDGTIRYVGKAGHPPTRLARYLRDEIDRDTSARQPWLRDLLDAGLVPILTEVERVPDAEWQDAERRWIDRLRADGQPLLNERSGGGGDQGAWRPNSYRIDGDTAYVKTNADREFAIDVADLPGILPYRWSASESRGRWYVYSNRQSADGKMTTVSLTRQIANPPDDLMVRFRDGNRFNFRRANLSFGKENPIRIDGERAYMTVKGPQGEREVLLDAADVAKVRSLGLRWHLLPNDYVFTSRMRGGVSETIYLHRFLIDTPEGMLADHIHGDRYDCRRSELRVVTPAQNSENRRGAQSNSKSGIRGVMYKNIRGSEYWIAQVRWRDEHGKVKAKIEYFPHTDEGKAQAAEAVVRLRATHLTHSDGR